MAFDSLPESPPFDALRLAVGEKLLFVDSNPTFHRTGCHGLVVTETAFYWYSPFWVWFARWRRFPLRDIAEARFEDSRFMPRLVIRFRGRDCILRTPCDSESHEMDYDRAMLKRTAEFVARRIQAR